VREQLSKETPKEQFSIKKILHCYILGIKYMNTANSFIWVNWVEPIGR
jgi:hypothetical protein